MFKKNKGHLQQDIFCEDPFAVSRVFKKLEKSEEYFFYKIILCNIDEDMFSPLYCNDNGRPNAPINVLVGAIILKEKRNWTYKQLIKEVEYNLAARTALGLFSLDDMPFNEATNFNFLNRLRAYEYKHHVSLFNEVFNSLTKQQIEDLKIKTNIARTDSYMIDSNIRAYGRIELLIEVLLRFYRILSDTDKTLFVNRYTSYQEKGSQHYMYDLKGSDLSHEAEKISGAYHWLKTFIADNYQSTDEYKIFTRVFEEQFKIEESNKLVLRDPKEMGSDTLQSPDDPDATFRKKNGKHQGQVSSVTETANPDNDLNLIVDIVNSPNNIDDSHILNERLPEIKKMLPDLEELHFDGGYGSVDNDSKMRKMGIMPVQTAVKGVKDNAEMNIEINDKNEIIVTCPHGRTVIAGKARKRYRAAFDFNKCEDCPLFKKCRAATHGNLGKYYFNEEVMYRKIRHHNILRIPAERRKIRANVEATMHEFTHRMNGHKLKVRGAFKASLFTFATAIAINFGRIYRYYQKRDGNPILLAFYAYIFKKVTYFLHILVSKSRISFQYC
jgi:Transposase DDE domain/Transposase domain (DUF772)